MISRKCGVLWLWVTLFLTAPAAAQPRILRRDPAVSPELARSLRRVLGALPRRPGGGGERFAPTNRSSAKRNANGRQGRARPLADKQASPWSSLFMVSLLLLCLTAILLAAGIYLRSRPQRHKRRARGKPPPLAAPQPPLAEGDALVDQGRLEEAQRAFYLAAVECLGRHLGLEEGNCLSDRALLSRLPVDSLMEAFNSLSGRFQPVHYGGQPARPRDLPLARREAALILELARTPP